MKRLLLLTVLAGIAASGLRAVAVPPATGVVKDRAGYFPNRKQAAVGGTAIGVLLTDGQPVLSTEGRSGPADQLVFSANGNSYRWVYVPVAENPMITNLQVPVGDKGQKDVYPSLSIASPRTVVPWGITAPYSLVEVKVNDGKGSPANDSFVGTYFKVLDGSKDYPLKVAEVVADLKKRYAEAIKAREKDLDKAMADHAAKSLKDKKPTGPREKSELMYVTWLNDSDALQVRFKTKMSDGAYTIIENPIGPKGPFKLPPKPAEGGNSVPFRVRPADIRLKTGTTFGIEFGQLYEVNKKGEIVRIDELPIETFTQQLNAPVIGPGPRPVPQPLPPVPVKPDL
jgi:hypothetical protein